MPRLVDLLRETLGELRLRRVSDRRRARLTSSSHVVGLRRADEREQLGGVEAATRRRSPRLGVDADLAADSRRGRASESLDRVLERRSLDRAHAATSGIVELARHRRGDERLAVLREKSRSGGRAAPCHRRVARALHRARRQRLAVAPSSAGPGIARASRHRLPDRVTCARLLRPSARDELRDSPSQDVLQAPREQVAIERTIARSMQLHRRARGTTAAAPSRPVSQRTTTSPASQTRLRE